MSQYNWSSDHQLLSEDPIVHLRHHTWEFSPNPIQPDIPEQNVKLPSGTQEDFPYCDKLSSMKNKGGTDLGLLCPERNRCPPIKTHVQERLQKPKLDCSVCGKLFDSPSALSKHAVGHSQQRKYVCSICKKAFKRQDHLTGHKLTHLTSKPFVCMELGCNKSYCGSRSLKRHLVVHHGQCTAKNDSAMDATCKQLQKSKHPKSFSLLQSSSKVETVPSEPSFSDMDFIRYRMSRKSQEQVVSNVGIQDPSESLVPQSVPLNGNTVVPEYTRAAINSVSSNTYTLINTTSKVSEDPEAILYPVLDSDCLGIQSDKALTNPEHSTLLSAAGSLQYLVINNLNGQPVEGNMNKSVEKYVTAVSTSEGTSLGDQNQKTLDTLSSTPQGSTQVTPPTYESSQLQNHHQLFITLVDLHPLFSQEQAQNQPTLTNYHYLPVMITRPITTQKDIRCTNGEQMGAFPKAHTFKSCTQAAEQAAWSVKCDSDSTPCSVPFTSIGKQKEQQLADRLTNAFTCSQLKSNKSKTDQKTGSHHQNSSLTKQLTMPTDNTVSPSQVTMESFSFLPKLPDKKKNSEMIFKRFQVENTYELPIEGRGGTDTANRLSTAFDMMELSDPGASLPSGPVVGKNPSMCRGEIAQRCLLQDVLKGRSRYCKRKLSPQAPKPSKRMMKDPGCLVMPVSVPVTVINHHEDNKVNERGGHLQNLNTKKRKRPLTKPLYIPPPLLDAKSSPTGCFQSNLSSPNTYLYEHFQNGIFRYPAYTPPPMLSPIRPGSGLYFNTICSPSSATGPNFSFPEKETSPCEILPVKDSIMFTVQPHINIGNRFQADIPGIQYPCSIGDARADLVWKPLKMTKSVSNFLNLACSSAVPGGGSNLEFALHCLHLSRGNTMEALDKLLIQDPQTYLPPYLADYHYAGSDYWSASEKQLFRKAYRNNRKDFSYIQAMISEKNIFQCVEYYYTWKHHVRFDKRGTSALEKESNFDGREFECNKNDVISGDKNTVCKTHLKGKAPQNIQDNTRDGIKHLRQFPCSECSRVFDKIKSRSAHMRKHCRQKRTDLLKFCEEESAVY